MERMPRRIARLVGYKRYFTGNPCKHGHVAERSVSNGNCLVCTKKHSRKWYAANSTKRAAADRKWQVNNRDKRAARTSERRARKRAVTCTCCSIGERAKVYSEARQCRMTVDHIIPISKGGPHCVHNFQIISQRANSEKGARYDTMIEGMQYLRNLGLA